VAEEIEEHDMPVLRSLDRLGLQRTIAHRRCDTHPKLRFIRRFEEESVVLRRALLVPTMVLSLAATPKPAQMDEPSYLPDATASRVVTVTDSGDVAAGITVLTQAVAIKETGPRATVARFGEVYAFAPAFIAVHRDEPTEISFWNLQPDDDHDFMLVDPASNVLMKVLLPALRKTTYVFAFHEEGLFTFYCTMHHPEMSGQILVLAPQHG
jgi:plastocyanin